MSQRGIKTEKSKKSKGSTKPENSKGRIKPGKDEKRPLTKPLDKTWIKL
ncbi:hypothetical protein [Methanosarcina sp. KYL-1]|nr:hypothetical protein [Methanosarcina sp. KYL-1]